MKPVCLDNLIGEIRRCIDTHNLGRPGAYARWLWGENRDLGLNPYGCADAANILYTIGDFPRDPAERAAWVSTLQAMQNPQTGLFTEPTHHTIHTTAHCLAALELFDQGPLYPCYALAPYTEREALVDFLAHEVNWQKPWSESHKGAGIHVCLTMTGMVGLAWKNWYFDWLWAHSDPETGFFFCGDEPRQAKLYEYMAGGFHYMFNHEAEHRPYRYPERIIDSCLYLMAHPDEGKMLRCCTFIDVDVVFSLNRAMRQTSYRFAEGKAALADYAEKYIAMMQAIPYEKDAPFNDLHMLFGAVCCLAELQAALPGILITSKPLKLVLDRRPFI